MTPIKKALERTLVHEDFSDFDLDENVEKLLTKIKYHTQIETECYYISCYDEKICIAF